MALVLSLKQGDVFNVGIRRFRIDDVISSELVILHELGQAKHQVSQGSVQTVGSDVSFQLSDKSSDATCRLMIYAPDTLPIWRRDAPSKADVSILAPVPLEHLTSALETVDHVGRVAFGTRAWKVFDEVDAVRKGQQVTVYIYPSHSQFSGMPKVRWMANYVQQVDGRAGKHPKGLDYRPESTHGSLEEQQNPRYWEVTDLRPLAPEHYLGMDRFKGLDTKKPYLATFRPEGPTRVEPL
ncbi:MAG: hypothetical protein V4747_15630 [Pseudomonadota bacterium]